MEKVIGIGGIFFKSGDSAALLRWYKDNLGIESDPSYGGTMFDQTAWTVMKSSTKYFEPSTKEFMVNYRVENIEAMIAQLRAAGVQVEDKGDSDFGHFAHASDPDGNRFELWQPPKEMPKA
jgi:predicted enzyme related to lactoylglutathione lyase